MQSVPTQPARPRTRHRSIVLAAGFVLLALAFVAPALPGTGTILGGEDLSYFRPPLAEERPPGLDAPSNALLQDPVEVFRPDLEWTVESVRAGELPLWNPSVGAGWPQLASQQTAPLFPLNLPAYVFGAWDAAGLIAGLRIVLAALGTYLFCRLALRQRRASALLAAAAFAAGAYLIAWLEHPHGNVYALLPWLLLATDRVITRGRALDAGALGAAVGAALLGGHPQSVVVDGLLVVPYAAWRLAPSGARALGAVAVSRIRTVALLAGGSVAGLAVGAVMLLPLLEFLGASATQERGGLGGIDVRGLASLALPELWGRPDGGFETTGPANYFERTIYVGAPAVLLAVAGLALRRDGGRRFFAVMAVAAAAAASTIPGVTWVADNVPPFSLVAMPRALAIAVFCVAVLAGFGLDAVVAADRSARRRALRVAAAAAALPLAWLMLTQLGSVAATGDALGALPLVPGEPESVAATRVGAVLRWCLFAGAVLATLVLLRRGRAPVAVAVAVLLVLQVADLVELGRGTHPLVDRAVIDAGPTPALARAVAEQGHGRAIGDRDYLLPNQGERFGLRDARVRGQPTIERVDALYAAYAGTVPRTFLADAPRGGAMLDAFGVGQLLTGSRPVPPPDASLQPVVTGGGDRLYRNPDALPRAFVATSWRRPARPEEALPMTAASTTAQLRDAPVVELAAGPPYVLQPPGGSVRFLVDGANRVTLDVSSPHPGRLVLLDAYYPGWTATVDGRDADIAPTNTAFRSVAVPAGRSTVEFRYRPRSFYAGAAISGIAVIALLAALATAIAQRRRR